MNITNTITVTVSPSQRETTKTGEHAMNKGNADGIREELKGQLEEIRRELQATKQRLAAHLRSTGNEALLAELLGNDTAPTR